MGNGMFVRKQRQLTNRRGRRSLGIETLETRELMVAHMLTNDWNDVEKSPSDNDDNLLCWAAAAANVLEWTGWGQVEGMETADQMFEHIQNHWEDGGNNVSDAWSWWFDGEDPDKDVDGATQVDAPCGGGFWTDETFSDYYHRDGNTATMIETLVDHVKDGRGIVLHILSNIGRDHFITVWGYETGPGGPDDIIGLYVTDSDDNKDLEDPPDFLELRSLKYDATDDRWYLGRGTVNPEEFKVEGNYFFTHEGHRVRVGELGGGIAARETATGQGYIMFSEENVFKRFDTAGATPHEDNSHHLIAVVCIEGEWYYDDNSNLHPFRPRSTDVLIAEVDFDQNTITSLAGVAGEEFKIQKGFAVGDLQFYANRFGSEYINTVRALDQKPEHVVPSPRRFFDPPELQLPPEIEIVGLKQLHPELVRVERCEEVLLDILAQAAVDPQPTFATSDTGILQSSLRRDSVASIDELSEAELEGLLEERNGLPAV